MKYQHFRPPGTPFRSTYNEILTFLLSAPFRSTYNEILTFFLSGGNFYYMSNEISTFPSPPDRLFDVRIMKYYHFCSPEVTFTTRILKYQHFLPPGTSFCSTYTEILTFPLSGGHFYYTYNEISTFAPSRNVLLLYVYWNINIFTLWRSLLLHVYWNINIFILPERLFALRILKY